MTPEKLSVMSESTIEKSDHDRLQEEVTEALIEPSWVSVQDALPSIVESFRDGTNYHGLVEAWYHQFEKHNRRESALWTSDSTKPRWVVNGVAQKIAPTHWRYYPGPPM